MDTTDNVFIEEDDVIQQKKITDNNQNKKKEKLSISSPEEEVNCNNIYSAGKIKKNLRYLKLLSQNFPTIARASTEIINLEAILNLPKGTEHYISDVHGEYETFVHILNNGSGVIKRKIDDIFKNTLREAEKKTLATLVYYPEKKLKLLLKEEENTDEWYRITLQRLIEICRAASSKYTRSKVRKALPKDFAYIIEELLHENENRFDKIEYFEKIIDTIIETERASKFIVALCRLIQRLSVDHLHIVGDIFDRGPSPDKIIEKLIKHHSVDIQWGNHDILWMGAASGSKAYIATVLRICARYNNLDIIEDSYGINTLPLATFAMEFYSDDPCKYFEAKNFPDGTTDKKKFKLIKQMHKAISIIQFKLEGQIIKRNPNFNMDDRLLLDKINIEDNTVIIEGKTYNLLDSNFPTIDKNNPYELTPEESELINKLQLSFLNSEKLQRHIKFLFNKGSMYLVFNSNLLIHGCVPMKKNGSFTDIQISGKTYHGITLLNKMETIARKCYFNRNNQNYENNDFDWLWYLWCGPNSPLFGKNKMATFERYFVKEKEIHKEISNPYFDFRDSEDACNNILKEFGLTNKKSHIINGHVPVAVRKGESPIKANGKLLVIDGGMAKAYQKITGIAGYTLIYNSYGLLLISHEPFESTQKAIEEENDILSSRVVLEKEISRIRVGDTDIGRDLKQQIHELKMLLAGYRKGMIKESRVEEYHN